MHSLRQALCTRLAGLVLWAQSKILTLVQARTWRLLLSHNLAGERPLPLPSGLSSPNFDSACRELRGVVGADWVLTADDRLMNYADPYSPGVAADYAPAGVVLPASVEEVRAVLGVANRYGLALWATSLRPNHAHCGGRPRPCGVRMTLHRLHA